MAVRSSSLLPDADAGQPGAAPAAVGLHGVSMRYGTGPLVLDGFQLAAAPGDFISLIGPSGCGKSTLLRLISGLSSATAGVVEVDGTAPAAARPRLGYIFQDATLLPWLTVARNLEAPLLIRGLPRAERHARTAAMLELVGLADVAGRYPRALSGGMRMRVSVARALALQPALLLLDEPFGALDEMTRNRLNEELLELRARQPFTAFFVTHSVAEAVFLSHRVVVMAARPGRVAAVVEVPFPFPRGPERRHDPEYQRLVGETLRLLRAVEEPGR